MEEIVIKLDVPSEMKDEFKIALEKVVKQFTRSLRFSLIKDNLKASKLTDEQANELAEELKERVAKRHGL